MEKELTKTLSGKVAVVTGGSRGIGAAIAKKLAIQGATVAIFYQNRHEAAEQVMRGLREQGGTVSAFKADVSDEEVLKTVMQEAARRFGKIDILINSAGIFASAPIGRIDRRSFHDQFFINTWSVVAATQAALPYFPPEGGAIVNVSSSLAVRPDTETTVYSASKAAVDSFTLGFAIELGARRIRVNAVAPHITRTDMTADIPQEHLREETKRTPLGRLAEPEDIADAVAFLCSDDSRWITGRSVLLDGGRM